MWLLVVPCLTLVGLLALLVPWTQRNPGHRPAVVAGLIAAAVVTALLAWSTAEHVPVMLVTALHEGTGRTTFGRAFGLEIHAGPLYQALIQAFGVFEVGDLRAVVRMNLWFWALSVIATAMVASGVFRTWFPVVLWTLIANFNPAAIHGALSETPASLLGLATWAGVLPVVVFEPARGQRELWNVVAKTTMFLLLIGTTLVRVEAAIVAAPIVATMLVRLRYTDDQLAAFNDRVLGAVRDRIRRWSSRPILPLIVLNIAAVLHFTRWVGEYRFGTTVWTLNVVGPEALGPIEHALAYLPTAVIVLAVPGWIRLTRRSWETGFVSMGLLALLRAYSSASNGVFYELFRYMAMGSPLLVLVAMLGWGEIERWIGRSRDPNLWKGVAMMVLPILFVAPAPAGMQRFVSFDRRDPTVEPRLPFLLGNLQQETVRLVVEANARWPTCAVVTRVTEQTAGAFRGAPWMWMIVEPGMRWPRELPAAGIDLAEVVRTEVHAPCAMFFAGQDCNLVSSADRCQAERAVGRPLIEHIILDGQYNSPPEFGRVLGESVIGVYAIGEVPPEQPAGRFHTFRSR